MDGGRACVVRMKRGDAGGEQGLGNMLPARGFLTIRVLHLERWVSREVTVPHLASESWSSRTVLDDEVARRMSGEDGET